MGVTKSSIPGVVTGVGAEHVTITVQDHDGIARMISLPITGMSEDLKFGDNVWVSVELQVS